MVPSFGSMTLVVTVASLAASAGGVWLSIGLARRAGVLDVPNERSSHANPTPRMGGVPLVMSAVAALGGWALLSGTEEVRAGLFAAVLYAFVMAVLGFWDDLSSLSPLFRFLVQAITAGLFLVLPSPLFPGIIPADGYGVFGLPSWVLALVATLWVVWMVNLYNFMDGIDGLAGGEAAVASSFFFLLFAREGEPGWAVANLFVAASTMGFLVYNWPPARVFMGDAGSAFLGGFYGMQAVLASMATPLPFIVLVLPFANFILDTTVTLVRRILRGEKWYQAHRGHFYQRMTNLGMPHRKVTTMELLYTGVCCFAALWYPRLGIVGRTTLLAVLLAWFGIACAWVARKERE